MVITNKELDAIQSYALFYYHFLKNNNITTFEELEDKLFSDEIFYNLMKKKVSDSKLNLKNFSFDVLDKVVLNYENDSILSKKSFFKNLSNFDDRYNFIERLHRDINYIFEVLGSKNSGLDNNIAYYENFINKQKYISINVVVTDLDYCTKVCIRNKFFIRSIDFENRLEAYNFLKPLYLKIKEIDYSLRILSKFLDIKMSFSNEFILSNFEDMKNNFGDEFTLSFNRKNCQKIYHLYYKEIDDLIESSNELFTIFSLLEKINKSQRYFTIEFNDNYKYLSLIEKGIHKKYYDEKGLLKKNSNGFYDYPFEIINKVDFNSTIELKKYMRGIYEEIFEYFI